MNDDLYEMVKDLIALPLIGGRFERFLEHGNIESRDDLWKKEDFYLEGFNRPYANDKTPYNMGKKTLALFKIARKRLVEWP